MMISKIESGRSMVEMLAVLIVVGFLSVVSIIGYEWAMDKNRVNTAINDMNIMRQNAVAQVMSDGVLKTQSTTNSIYPMELFQFPEQSTYDIYMSNVPGGVCDILLSVSMAD